MGLEHREVPQSPFHVLPQGQSTNPNKAAKLLDLLLEGGPEAFDVFVGALLWTDQKKIAIELLKQEEEKAVQVLFPI